MKQELDQIAPTISENPFMKNDRKKKGDLPQQSETNSLTPSSIESRSVDDSLPYDDDLQALKKDDLKRELCTVLEGIRKTEDINDEVLFFSFENVKNIMQLTGKVFSICHDICQSIFYSHIIMAFFSIF